MSERRGEPHDGSAEFHKQYHGHAAQTDTSRVAEAGHQPPPQEGLKALLDRASAFTAGRPDSWETAASVQPLVEDLVAALERLRALPPTPGQVGDLIAEAEAMVAKGNFAQDVGSPDYRNMIRRLVSALRSPSGEGFMACSDPSSGVGEGVPSEAIGYPLRLERIVNRNDRGVGVHWEIYAEGRHEQNQVAWCCDESDARAIFAALSAAVSPTLQPPLHEPELLCEDCPPTGYPTDKTRCEPCPRLPTLSPSVAEGDFGACSSPDIASVAAENRHQEQG